MSCAWDVLVIGGGPAGASAARAAVLEGARTLLIERDARPRDKICGEYVCPGAVRRLLALGFGPGLEPLERRPLEGMRLFAPSGREVRTTFPEGAAGWSIRRREFDARLVESCGAEVRRGVRATGIESLHDRVRVETTAGAIEARMVVGADGRHGLVAARLRLGRPVRRERAALHTYYREVADCTGRGEMHLLGDGRYVGLNPGPGGRLNFTLVGDPHQLGDLDPERAESAVQAALEAGPGLRARFAGARRDAPIRALAPLKVRAGPPRTPRVLLAGDAAGFLDPLTGEGMLAAVVSGAHAGALAARAAADPARWRPQRRLARTLRAERGARPYLQRFFQWMLDKPTVLEWLGRRLDRRPGLADRLIGVIGNVLPPAALLHLPVHRTLPAPFTRP